MTTRRVLAKGKVVYNPRFKDASGEWVEKWEGIGNKREARSKEVEYKRQVSEGTYGQEEAQSTDTLRTWFGTWIDLRTNKTKDKDRQRMVQYVLPEHGDIRLCDLKKKDPIKLVRKLIAQGKNPKTVSNIWGAYCRCLRDAEIEELVPWTASMPKGTIPKRQKPIKEIYSNEDVQSLLRGGERADMRLMGLITFFAGMRCGEICGLRWGDWQDRIEGESEELLGSFTVSRQYDGIGDNAETKTKEARIVPVHPVVAVTLRKLLAERPRNRNEAIVEYGPRGFHNRHTAQGGWRRHTLKCGARPLGLHRIRHTAITAMRRGGATQKDVELITHNSSGSMVDRYTHDWGILCRVVRGIDYGSATRRVLPRVLLPEATQKLLENRQKKNGAGGCRSPRRSSVRATAPLSPRFSSQTP